MTKINKNEKKLINIFSTKESMSVQRLLVLNDILLKFNLPRTYPEIKKFNKSNFSKIKRYYKHIQKMYSLINQINSKIEIITYTKTTSYGYFLPKIDTKKIGRSLVANFIHYLDSRLNFLVIDKCRKDRIKYCG